MACMLAWMRAHFAIAIKDSISSKRCTASAIFSGEATSLTLAGRGLGAHIKGWEREFEGITVAKSFAKSDLL